MFYKTWQYNMEYGHTTENTAVEVLRLLSRRETAFEEPLLLLPG
jgi:hypothetical protein